MEFSYYLASELKMTVADVGLISNKEYVRWQAYYGRKAQREELARKVAGR